MSENIDDKIAGVVGKLASAKREAKTEREQIILSLKKQKAKLQKALSNGFTRKEILEELRKTGIVIAPRDLTAVLGKRESKNNAYASPRPQGKPHIEPIPGVTLED